MTVRNPVKEARDAAIPSTATPETLAQAIAQIDFTQVAPEKRAQAILDQVGRVMVGTALDRDLAQQIATARLRAMTSNPR